MEPLNDFSYVWNTALEAVFLYSAQSLLAEKSTFEMTASSTSLFQLRP